MSESDVKQSVKQIARRIHGYKGKVKLDLAKLDTNFTTLKGNPASQDLLDQVKRHFNHVDTCVQRCRELYIEVMGLVSSEEWEAEWAEKSDELEEDMNRAERALEKAQKIHSYAIRQATPTPGPQPGPAPGPAAGKQQPRVDIHLQPSPLTEDSKPNDYREWQEGFSLWMNLSSLNEQKEADKITILKRVISHQIAVRCDLDAKRSIAEALSAIDFWSRYPTVALRLEYGRLRQKSSQSSLGAGGPCSLLKFHTCFRAGQRPVRRP